jgi:hypothetical protein
MLILWGLLLLTVWMVLARGIPSFFAELRSKPSNPISSMPPVWALLVSAAAIYGLDLGYRNLLPHAESHQKLQELVSLIESNDYRAAVKKLQDVANDPPWTEPAQLDEPRQPIPF